MPRKSTNAAWIFLAAAAGISGTLIAVSILNPADPTTGPVPTRVRIIALQEGERQAHWHLLRGKHTVVENLDLGSRFYVTGWLGEEGDEFMLEPEPRRGAANTSTRLQP